MKNKVSNSFFKRIMSQYLFKEKPLILSSILSMLIVALSVAVQAYLLRPIIDNVFVKQSSKMLILIPTVFFLSSIMKAVSSFYKELTLRLLGHKVVTNMQIDLYTHVVRWDLSIMNQYPSGNLISRFNNDITIMRNAFTDAITGIFLHAATMIGLLINMYLQDKILLLIMLCLIPITFIAILLFGKYVKKVSLDIQREMGVFTTCLNETFSNIKIIKSYVRENYEINKAKGIIKRYFLLHKKLSYIGSASSPLMEIIVGAAITFILVYCGSKAMSENLTAGSMVSFITSLTLSYTPLKSLSRFNNSLQEGLVAAARYFQIIDKKRETSHEMKYKKLISYNIKFNNVNFKYQDSKPVLQNLSFNIVEGKHVAFVGESGSGKSTIFNLLSRFYEANSGTITVGGKNILNIDTEVLRHNIALVTQDVYLFNDTVYENIRYGKLDANREEIISASMAASSHEFVEKLDKGYDTVIGQGGLKLSGGQKQRIAIARAILKNASILLLDEATSALDNISEKKIQLSLDYLKKGKTVVSIAHRLSTISSADYIFLFHQGQIKEHGKHEDLMKQGGRYYALYKKKDRNV